METIGFKSFAERIQMDFVPGVTAVVGPNGSGKSNVIDAIRWVLGEQSAKSLRGQKMEDIIFQGSETRKGLNFAEVSLILNNEEAQLPIDYQEVDVTRRVYRSGESEFYLNKQPCRLKDIIDLFMDTGLGKESFSIIGQGRIDEILSSKPENRRAVFEEAAGVLKYKQRKKQAEFKLMDTEDNLDRVEDILHEITQQLEPLEKQAEAARKYKKHQAHLKQTEISLLVTQIGTLHSEWQQALMEVESGEKATLEKKTSIQNKEAQLTAAREQIQELEERVAKKQEELLNNTEQLKQFEGDRDVLLEQTKHEKENKTKLNEQKQSTKSRLTELNQLCLKEKEELDKASNETRNLQESVDKLEQKLSVTPEKLDASIEHLKSDYIEQLNEQAITKNELKRLEDQKVQLKVQEEEQQKSYQLSAKDETTLAKEKEAWTVKRDHYKDELVQLETTRKELQAQLENERESLQKMQEKLAVGNEKIARLTSRKEMLEEMKDSYQGFYFGAKEILKAKDRGAIQNVLGAVIDLIQVPNRYMTAMETVLGAQAQYIVVENDQAARNGIKWLKQENKGRATFLPLQSISPKNIPSRLALQLEEQPGFVGIAADLIETDKVYDRLKFYLLGNVIVADQLQHANQIAVVMNRRFRIVTLDGDVVFPGGSMSGGAKKNNNQSLFTREKEIAELTKTLQDFTERTTAFEKKLKMQKETIEHIEQEQHETIQRIENTKSTLDEAQSTLHDVALKYSRALSEVKNFETMTTQYQREYERLNEQYDTLLDKQKQVNTDLEAKDYEIQNLTEQKQTLEQDEKITEDELYELKIKQAEKEERKKAIQDRYDTLLQQYDETYDQLQSTETELSAIMDEKEREQRDQNLKAKITELQQAKETISETLKADQVKREQIVQETNDEENELRGMQQKLESLTKQLQEKEVQANRLDVTVENHLNRLQSSYKMTYERAQENYEPVENVNEATEQVESLKTAIERLGSVNLGAIEELERLRERESFLRTQQEDLLEAKDTLYQVIREMDEEMTKRFSEVFQEIQNAFSDVFTQLFGGGYASLQLTNPEDMLETGIDISARPPGKKLKTLGLLSGGERALTAIALLFAILHVRPVPFCILDEVDAALDEANVERFGKYLRNFSTKTQFIVITHRKGTMEEANALYGVTMQESGVSRLVSVKLEEATPLVATT